MITISLSWANSGRKETMKDGKAKEDRKEKRPAFPSPPSSGCKHTRAGGGQSSWREGEAVISLDGMFYLWVVLELTGKQIQSFPFTVPKC